MYGYDLAATQMFQQGYTCLRKFLVTSFELLPPQPNSAIHVLLWGGKTAIMLVDQLFRDIFDRNPLGIAIENRQGFNEEEPRSRLRKSVRPSKPSTTDPEAANRHIGGCATFIARVTFLKIRIYGGCGGHQKLV